MFKFAAPLALQLGILAPGNLSMGGSAPLHMLTSARREELEPGNLLKIRAAVLKRSRGHKEPCIIPDSLVHRLNAGPGGAMVVSFSHSGHLLAVAGPAVATSLPLAPANSHISPFPGCLYSIRVFDTDTGLEAWSLHTAHHGIIYSLTWSKDDSALLSTSSDGTAKVWNTLALHPSIKKFIQKLERDEKDMILHNKESGPEASLEQQRTRTTSPGAESTSQDDLKEAHSNSLTEFRTACYSLLPSLYSVYAHAPPVYVYCGVFQEVGTGSVPSSSLGSTFGSTSGASDSLPAKHISTHPVLRYIAQQLDGVDSGEKEIGLPDAEMLHSLSLPRLFTGSSDGRIRCWEGKHTLVGEVTVNADNQSYPAHEGRIHSMAIDERSRYLLTGDHKGEMTVWRLDGKGWYQLLRKFRKDVNQAQTNKESQNSPYPASGPQSEAREQTESWLSGGVSTMMVHPDKNRAQLLTLSHAPQPALRVYSLSTYKPLSTCAGFKGLSAQAHDMDQIAVPFVRATFSADGHFAACGVPVIGGGKAGSGSRSGGGSGINGWRVRVWDSQTGHPVLTPLSGKYILCREL
jgi:WD40 repeat protein